MAKMEEQPTWHHKSLKEKIDPENYSKPKQ